MRRATDLLHLDQLLGLGFRVWGLGFRVQGLGFIGFKDLGFRD